MPMTVPPAASGPRASMGISAGMGSVIGSTAGAAAATSWLNFLAGSVLDTTGDSVPAGRPAGAGAALAPAPLTGRVWTRPATVAGRGARFSDLEDGSPNRTGIGAPEPGAARTATGAKGG